MWRKEEPMTQAVAEISTATVNSMTAPAPAAANSRENSAQPPVSPRAIACISQGIKIRGEIHGSEDLFLDGVVEGKLDFGSASLTIGPNGRIKANITAREVIVRGRVEGKVTGRERVHVWSTGRIDGEVECERLVIDDGAALRGKIEAGKKSEQPREAFQKDAARVESGAVQKQAEVVAINPAAD